MPDTIRLSTLVDSYPLLELPFTAVLTTVGPDGRLQSTLVWFVCDRQHLLVSTMREFAKARNLRCRPVSTLLVVNPHDTTDWVEVRAKVSLEEESAQDLLDDIAHRYTGRRPYFGQVVSADLATSEHPITCRLEPVAMTTPPLLPTVDRPAALPQSRTQPPPPPRLPMPVGCGRESVLPSDHLDLLDAPLVAALATRLPSGFPQTQPVWYARDGNDILVNTTLQRRKGRNMLADPRATLLIVDPADSSRWIEIRADVDLSTVDAEQQLDALTRKYTHTHYYGQIYPVDQRKLETRVVARLHPRAVHCDAIHR